MERLFSPEIFKTFLKKVDNRRDDLKYIGDISDFGNEIGVLIGNLYPEMTDVEINEFIMGFRHGVSVTKKVQ